MAIHTHLIKQEEAQTENGVQLRAADPGAPVTNQLWVNTTSKLIKYYDGASIKVLGSSGGGGGSLQWIEDANAPLALIENGRRIYAFQQVLAQVLWAVIAVPTGYIAGNQILLKMAFYSPDSAGNVLIKTISTLNRVGTDAVTSTANQRTSTNTTVTLAAGTVNKFQALSLDLTSSVGQINGVAVSPGDEILVQLTRDNGDTATSDAKVAVYKAEATFS